MDQLVERVREALAAEYPGAPNGRVRDVPDRRAIRWYTTIGLVDRPLGMRGRTALYGPKHLQQLVAIKRRQAEGRSLAQIQIEFSWISDEGLRLASRIPDQLLADDGALTADDPAGTARPRFWAESPTPAAGPSGPHVAHLPFLAMPAENALAGPEAVPAAAPAGPPPTPATTSATGTSPATTSKAGTNPVGKSPVGKSPVGGTADRRTAEAVCGVALGGGVILLLPRPVADRDRADIAAAAAPLLDLLAGRGLTDGSSS